MIPAESLSAAENPSVVLPRGAVPTRDELALQFFEKLQFTPYPVQEQALYAWFGTDEGVLVCAPTGTGKTVIAESAAFEALHTGTIAYITTPLIALTEQKFLELQRAAVRWGFRSEDVGLITGHRKVNPEARVLVVVAEILLNRLLHRETDHFEQVSAVVMDEFHSFADADRGIVWEFSLSLLPKHVRLLLLSATIGNAVDFLSWLRISHGRNLELVQGTERKVPLQFSWVADKLLTEHLPDMAQGDAEARYTPALVFCFNREECWSVAEELKGKDMLAEGQQKLLVAQLAAHEWTRGAGPKLKQILMRGVGVHHAGLLPKYRRIVEDLFQKKLLSVCVCTETLSAGINLPARSVVLPSLIKGPPGKQKLIDASSAHQIFGRAGRPQFDTRGYVFAVPHEDDVRILRWKEKLDQIPEDTRDPGLMQARKALKKKMPTRSPNRQYWNEAQFEKLRTAAPRSLASQGPLPWRMLAYMLQLSPEVDRVRQLVSKRLLTPKQLELAETHLHHMLRTLHDLGVIRLEPAPPERSATPTEEANPSAAGSPADTSGAAPQPVRPSSVAQLIMAALREQHAATGTGPVPLAPELAEDKQLAEYRPMLAHPTEKLAQFFLFRSINPVYALFLLELLGQADPVEKMQLFESVLELPGSLLRYVRVPSPDRMPPGPLAVDRVDGELVGRGVITAQDLYPPYDPDIPFEERKYAPALGEKVRMLFESYYPGVHGVFVQPAWAAGDLLQFGWQFDKYIGGRNLAKQEGLIYRHVLRLILLLAEFSEVTPVGVDPQTWRDELREWIAQFTQCCQEVDPQGTEAVLSQGVAIDIAAELAPRVPVLVPPLMAPRGPVAADAITGEQAAVPPSDGHVPQPVHPAEATEETSAEATSEAVLDEFGGGIIPDGD